MNYLSTPHRKLTSIHWVRVVNQKGNAQRGEGGGKKPARKTHISTEGAKGNYMASVY